MFFLTDFGVLSQLVIPEKVHRIQYRIPNFKIPYFISFVVVFSKDISAKAEFTEVDIFFLLQLFARDILSMKETKIT